MRLVFFFWGGGLWPHPAAIIIYTQENDLGEKKKNKKRKNVHTVTDGARIIAKQRDSLLYVHGETRHTKI